MEEQTRTKRKYLCGRTSAYGKKMIDMEAVYRAIDSGKKLTLIAAELGVSRTTLYRRHKEYQKEIEVLEHEAFLNNIHSGEYQLPPLPEA